MNEVKGSKRKGGFFGIDVMPTGCLDSKKLKGIPVYFCINVMSNGGLGASALRN
ncbi:hypothetical protein HMPREF1981_00438 [Bacteroides pyogenes F0041]|uniref:Uncharacterized protein n=1 Tax=Bacteroides pyogenes F0041 TaxID=1321819 RepID=U2CX69_9BACE|nr:hypothetical protein HMPREF1981_00438 [Bacteroides pyogenes F0041]